MDILIAFTFTVIIATQAFICFVLIHIEKWLSVLCSIEPEPEPEEAKVTDPFQKPSPIYSSTDHIIVPKTPAEIRNQNYKKIKEGLEYGDIAKR